MARSTIAVSKEGYALLPEAVGFHEYATKETEREKAANREKSGPTLHARYFDFLARLIMPGRKGDLFSFNHAIPYLS